MDEQLTPEVIRGQPAGPQMDAWCAGALDETNPEPEPPPYSTDPEVAGLLETYLAGDGWQAAWREGGAGGCRITLRRGAQTVEASAPTRALALCRAFLLAELGTADEPP